jgi:hypothetical protein
MCLSMLTETKAERRHDCRRGTPGRVRHAGKIIFINSTGGNLIRASISQLNSDGAANGSRVLNLLAFEYVNVVER